MISRRVTREIYLCFMLGLDILKFSRIFYFKFGLEWKNIREFVLYSIETVTLKPFSNHLDRTYVSYSRNQWYV